MACKALWTSPTSSLLLGAPLHSPYPAPASFLSPPTHLSPHSYLRCTHMPEHSAFQASRSSATLLPLRVVSEDALPAASLETSPNPQSAFVSRPSARFLHGTCDSLAFTWVPYINTNGLCSLNSQAGNLILVVPHNIGNMRE